MYRRALFPLLRSALRHPWWWLAAAIVVSVPAAIEASRVRVDTNLKRLLPVHSRAAAASRELGPAVSDGGYLSVLFEGDDGEALRAAVESAAARIAAIPGTQSVEYRNPVEFLRRYRYTLLDEPTLERIRDSVAELQAEMSPAIAEIGDGEEDQVPLAERDRERRDIEAMARRYSRLGELHQSADGRVVGMIVRTAEGIGNLERLRRFYHEVEAIAAAEAAPRGLWHGVGGNLRNRIEEYDQILGDLNRGGTISVVLILAVLVLSFRSLRAVPVLVAPLAAGLLWSFALVPTLVGDLNTITSFLLMILFGMGADFSIHLVKRFQAEIAERGTEEAMLETYASTGRSVLTSSITTAAGMFLLRLSDFRGFADFGVIGGVSLVVVTLAMYLVLPAAMVVGQRARLLVPRRAAAPGRGGLVWGRVPTLALALVVLAGAVLALRLEFDYDFTTLGADVTETAQVRERHRQVYAGVSAPAAVYVARDLAAADRALVALERARAAGGDVPAIGALRSLRDLAPERERHERRVALIVEIQDILQGRWVERIEDPERRRLVEDLREFEPPDRPAAPDEVPASLARSLVARDGSGAYLVAVDTPGRSKDGRLAMRFTRALYDTELGDGVEGPTGDKPVLAEILWLVTREGPFLAGLTFAAVFLLVLLDFRSLTAALWVILPLVSGVLLTLGAATALGWKLNCFNMVVLPTLIGISEDHGVHIYRRWTELGRSVRHVQAELFEPLSTCSLTTIMGYAGMQLAHHQGLLAIGNLAVLGLVCCWLTSLLLLPGLLALRERRASRPRA